MRVFCIDREHVAYMKRFYPALPVEFLPLAGNCILEREVPSPIEGCHGQKQKHKNIPYQKRKYDIVFTGNYTPVEHLYREIDRQVRNTGHFDMRFWRYESTSGGVQSTGC